MPRLGEPTQGWVCLACPGRRWLLGAPTEGQDFWTRHRLRSVKFSGSLLICASICRCACNVSICFYFHCAFDEHCENCQARGFHCQPTGRRASFFGLSQGFSRDIVTDMCETMSSGRLRSPGTTTDCCQGPPKNIQRVMSPKFLALTATPLPLQRYGYFLAYV